MPIALAAQVPDTTGARSDTTREVVHYRLPFADIDLGKARWPARFSWPWVNGRIPAPGEAGIAFDSAMATIVQLHRDDARRARLLRTAAGLVESPTGQLRERGLFGLAATTAQLDVNGTFQVDINSTLQRNLACTAALLATPLSGCTGGFTPPKIDNTLQLQAQGVFGQRFHVDIDLDTKADFSNQNIVRAYYRGLQDEVLQEVNVGSVQFHAPPSRFLTAGIPINNFGLSAVMVKGPFRLEGIAATQKGSALVTKTISIGQVATEPIDRQARDLDYQAGRFFWVVNPTTLPGFPAVDILNLGTGLVTADAQPTDVRVYRYTAANAGNANNPNADGISAVGLNGTQVAGPLRWQLLKQGVDYWLDPSGLWFALANALSPDDYLAVSYRTASGGTVGTFPAASDPARKDTLRLLLVPNSPADAPTFPYEMRQVYRVARNDLTRSTMKLGIEVARSQSPGNGVGTYLSLLGMAIPTDPASFDVDNRLFPRFRDPGADSVLQDAFIVFPNAQPFGDASRLSATVRNDSLYRTPEYLLFTEGPPSKFQLDLHYEAKTTGDQTGFSLGGFQLKEGSEQIFVNGTQLTPGVDYTIEYTTGRVTFRDPTTLFGRNGGTVVAKFEQKGVYQVAPTSIAGLTATWTSRFGALNFAGLYQAEATASNRPQLGYEPKSSLISGVTGDFHFQAPGITRLMNGLVRKASSAPSGLDLSGELALSRPDPNRAGLAYLEDFENDGALQLPLIESSWVPGSVPQQVTGVSQIPGFATAFDSADAVQLTWQSFIPDASGHAIQLSPQDIDTTIKLTNSVARSPAPVLFMALHADTAGGLLKGTSNTAEWTLPERKFRPRWRTIQAALSPTGADLSHNTYIEFWVLEQSDKPLETAGMHMVFDLGKVSEDGLAIAPDSFTVHGTDTTWTGRQYVGVGRLDSERDPIGNWNAVSDDVGILADRPDSVFGANGEILHRPKLCQRALSADFLIFPWGDLGARCTVGNGGVPDDEDLDGDNVLNAQGPDDNVFRYDVPLGDTTLIVRTRTVTDAQGKSTPFTWTLYRVPLRSPTATIGQPDMRRIKQLRIAFMTPTDNGAPDPVLRFAIALLRLAGAPWIGRAAAPIDGISGPIAQPHGSVTIGSISTQDVQLGYTPPPGITNQSANLTNDPSQLAQQVNEKSLRIVATDLRQGERAEAYLRNISGTQNLQAYHELRVWAHGHGEGWDDGTLDAYIKVGSDAFNFYMYRAPAGTATWDPEMVIDLDRWRALRSEVELRVERGEPPSGADTCGGDPQAYVACDGPYLIQARDPLVNPPNLVAVQELAAGILNVSTGAPVASTELWIDDIRLGAPVSAVGMAGALSARLAASDVGTVDISYVAQDGNFRQIGQNPTYRGTASLTATTTWHLDRFLPTALGLNIPFNLTHSAGRANPILLAGSDVSSAPLEGFRKPRDGATSWSISIQRGVRNGNSALVRFLVDPLSFAAQGTRANVLTELSRTSTSTWNAGFTYFVSGLRHGVPLGFGGLVKRLPKWFRESDGGRSLAGSRLALLPTQLQLSTGLSHTMGDLTSYAVPIERLSDTILKPLTNEQRLWRNTLGIGWQPLGLLQFNSSWVSTRDLRRYADSTALGRLAGASRQSLLGQDIGVERDRNFVNGLLIAPRLSSWLRPRVGVNSSFVLSRSLTSRNPVRVLGDTAGEYILPQTLNNSRQVEMGFTLDPVNLTRDLFGDSSHVTRFLSGLRTIEFTRTRVLQSTYDLARFTPGLDYQLALGSFDAFLRQGDERAIGALSAVTSTGSLAFDFPGGFGIHLSYSSADDDRYQRGVVDGFLVTTTHVESWPNGGVSWRTTFRDGPLSSLSARADVRKQLANSVTPITGGAPTTISSSSSNADPSVDLLLRNGVSLTASGTFSRATGLSNGNTTLSRTDGYNANVSWSVRLPRFLSPLRKPLTTSLSVTNNAATTCLRRAGDSTCVPYSDVHRLDLTGRFDAQLRPQLRAGLDFGWVLQEIRTLQRKTSTINLGAFFVVPLSSIGM